MFVAICLRIEDEIDHGIELRSELRNSPGKPKSVICRGPTAKLVDDDQRVRGRALLEELVEPSCFGRTEEQNLENRGCLKHLSHERRNSLQWTHSMHLKVYLARLPPLTDCRQRLLVRECSR